ncbi:MAG: type II toxin-antitoxin system VapC family toxin [Caldilineaceae bacterium]
MIVADTNLISYLLLTGSHSEVAEQVLQKDAEWIAPLLWKSEFRNVLALYVRQTILTLDEAFSILDAADELMAGNAYEVSAYRVLQLTQQSGCSAYDCEFVVLAEDMQVPLVTSDRKILTAFPNLAVSPREFCEPSNPEKY